MTLNEVGVIPAQAGIHPAATRIALLGAESTGKTQLAQEIAARLRERGLRAVAVPEALRAWCVAAGRPPRTDEQLAIARDQEAAVDAAAREADFVVADTTALMVAIHAGMIFPDGDLLRFALERQQAYTATLVTGLDLPSLADRLHRDAGQSREDVDALVRSLLHGAGLAFQVVYGQGPQRLDSALQALDAAGVLPAGIVRRARESDAAQAWTWVCDKCSDPACEHRLFTRLRESR